MTDHVWHSEVIGPNVEQTLKARKERSLLEGFFLAGGTGLALQLDDADAEPMPNMLMPLGWQEVKDFFRERRSALIGESGSVAGARR
jgi:hypothetical protein